MLTTTMKVWQRCQQTGAMKSQELQYIPEGMMLTGNRVTVHGIAFGVDALSTLQ